MGFPLLYDIVIIFGLSVVVVFGCHLAKIPTIVGFLATGIIAGPHALGLIEDVHEVEVLAEIGVLLLLFTIGVEFSLRDLIRIRRSLLLGGALQMGLTVGATFLIATTAGLGPGEAAFLGFLLSLSSTAIVLRSLQERAEIDTAHGRTTLAILIFQDIAIVPMVLLSPALVAGSGGAGFAELAALLAKGLGLVAFAIIAAKWIVPWVLFQVARTRSRELFLLSVIVLCFAVAWLTAKIGLSLALGAFMAGLIIAESEYSHQALGDILPFRDVFTSFFFVSVGMLFDVGFLVENAMLVVLLALGAIVLKSGLAGISALALELPLQTAVSVGLALGQIGEFSFVLSRVGVEYGLLDHSDYVAFLTVSVVTMALTPSVGSLAPFVSRALGRLPLPARLKTGHTPLPPTSETTGLTDHLIIVGFGINGRNVARAAAEALIPYVVIEMNPHTVRAERAHGEDIHYGDAANATVLEHAGIHRARVLVVTAGDAAAARGIAALAHRMRPEAHVIVRTRYMSEVGPLCDLGADEVIPEEFETSVEMFTRVLRRFLVPADQIARFADEIRSGGYAMFSGACDDAMSGTERDSYPTDAELETYLIPAGSPLIGRALGDLGVRKWQGVRIAAIRRRGQTITAPGDDETVQAHDLLHLLGTPDRVADIVERFGAPE